MKTISETQTTKSRFVYLDIFRGITIFAMLIVNNPGSWGHIYAPFKHAKWHGFGGADWIFPFFLFILGFAIPISLSSSIDSGKSTLSLIGKILKRSVLLFLLGIFLNGFPDFNWNTIRIPGVLQRIALVYFFSALIYLFCNRKLILFLSLFFILFHWFLLTQIPIPEIGNPSLEMGKNLSSWIDSYFLPNHLWAFTKTWDPEGILGTLPAISSSLIGIFYGLFFLEKKYFSTSDTYFGFFLGLLLISLSFLWDIVFPINKNLWTGSFVLLNSGLAMICLHLLYNRIELNQSSFLLKPFEIFGVNPIASFFLSSLFSRIINIPMILQANGKLIGIKTFLYTNYFSSFFSSYNASLLWSLIYTMFWLILFGILYKRKIFIKI